MTRRIREAIVGVTAAIVVLLGLPLAVAVNRLILDAEVVKLQATATRTLAEVSLPLDRQELAAIRRETDAPPPFTVYDAHGERMFGSGTRRADALVRHALRGNLSTSTAGSIDVAMPISDRSPAERVVGVVRITEPRAVVDHRAQLAWLAMAGSAAGAIGLAWLIGNRLARRLSQPLIDLAEEAGRIGDGGEAAARGRSGIDEIDRLSVALSTGTERVNAALTRERRFSADVSHQLRTPVTALLLQLEQARDGHRSVEPTAALDELERLMETIDHLLAVARDAVPHQQTDQLDLVVGAVVARWRRSFQEPTRALRSVIERTPPVQGSPESITQVLDVLIDNARRHGRGIVGVTMRHLAGGVAVDVSDEGDGIGASEVASIFTRGHGQGNGIGLALARSLAQAEGARLVVTHLRPPVFSLVLACAEPAASASAIQDSFRSGGG